MFLIVCVSEGEDDLVTRGQDNKVHCTHFSQLGGKRKKKKRKRKKQQFVHKKKAKNNLAELLVSHLKRKHSSGAGVISSKILNHLCGIPEGNSLNTFN